MEKNNWSEKNKEVINALLVVRNTFQRIQDIDEQILDLVVKSINIENERIVVNYCDSDKEELEKLQLLRQREYNTLTEVLTKAIALAVDAYIDALENKEILRMVLVDVNFDSIADILKTFPDEYLISFYAMCKKSKLCDLLKRMHRLAISNNSGFTSSGLNKLIEFLSGKVEKEDNSYDGENTEAKEETIAAK